MYYGRSRFRIKALKPPWRTVESLPEGHVVEVLTITGLLRRAILGYGLRFNYRRTDFHGLKVAHCWSKHTQTGEDLQAIAWRPMPYPSERGE